MLGGVLATRLFEMGVMAVISAGMTSYVTVHVLQNDISNIKNALVRVEQEQKDSRTELQRQQESLRTELRLEIDKTNDQILEWYKDHPQIRSLSRPLQ